MEAESKGKKVKQIGTASLSNTIVFSLSNFHSLARLYRAFAVFLNAKESNVHPSHKHIKGSRFGLQVLSRAFCLLNTTILRSTAALPSRSVHRID